LLIDFVQVGTELKKITSTKRGDFAPAPPPLERKLDRSMTTAARALKGIKFLSENMVTQGWPEVEKRFEKLAVDGVLLRSRFGQCIGQFMIQVQFIVKLTSSHIGLVDLLNWEFMV
jgi:Respiratory burst NADPH oxidase